MATPMPPKTPPKLVNPVCLRSNMSVLVYL